MQDRSHQPPILGLVPVEGEGKSVDELDEECRAELLAVARRHLGALAGSTSLWLPFLAVIAAEASDGAMAQLIQVG